MAKSRKNPIASMDSIEQDPHQKKLSEMHDALHQLGDKIRKPWSNGGEKLLPKALGSEQPEAKLARKHIDNLHSAMKGCKD
jgi:hypothetical protein